MFGGADFAKPRLTKQGPAKSLGVPRRSHPGEGLKLLDARRIKTVGVVLRTACPTRWETLAGLGVATTYFRAHINRVPFLPLIMQTDIFPKQSRLRLAPCDKASTTQIGYGCKLVQVHIYEDM